MPMSMPAMPGWRGDRRGIANWYKNDSGRVTQNWPFPLVEYWEATRAPNPDDFIFQGNRGGKAG
jgi:4-hydroxyacetophenone monooxygenase